MSGDSRDALLRALRHPTRRRILSRLLVGKHPASPRQVAENLREPLSNVSYHFLVLADCGAVVLVDTAPARGSVQHFYEPNVTDKWVLDLLQDPNAESK